VISIKNPFLKKISDYVKQEMKLEKENKKELKVKKKTKSIIKEEEIIEEKEQKFKLYLIERCSNCTRLNNGCMGIETISKKAILMNCPDYSI